MTKQQIFERYQDWEVVQEIIDLKLQSADTNMPHPDAPHVDARGPTVRYNILKV